MTLEPHKRIPLHEHSNRNDGGPVKSSGVWVAGVSDGGDPGVGAADLTAHTAASDPHTGYVREADASWIDLTDSGATTLHSHSGSGSVATDTIFDAKGDLPVGTGADTAAKLTVGANDTILMADSAQATGLKWVASATPSGGYGTAATGSADTFLRGDAILPKPTEADLSLADNTTNDASTSAHGFLKKLPGGTSTFLRGDGSFAAPSLLGGSIVAHGCGAYNSTNYALATAGEDFIKLDTETYDTDAYHFTSDAALTGTVSKTATSSTITGSGTSFTTELAVGQVFTIPGTAVEIAVVTAIASNISLTIDRNMANTASGQTGTRRSGFVVIPSGGAGKYIVTMAGRTSAATNPYMVVRKNPLVVNGGTILLIANQSYNATNAFGSISQTQVEDLVAGDVLELAGLVNTATNLVSSGGPQPWFSVNLFAT